MIQRIVTMELSFECADRTEENSTRNTVETYVANNGGEVSTGVSISGETHLLNFRIQIPVDNISDAQTQETTLNNALPGLPDRVPNTLRFTYDAKEVPDPVLEEE